MKNLTITLFLTLTSLFAFSQEIIENTNSLEDQFDEVYRKSSNYLTYKVISKERFESLKLNVLDSLSSSKKTISEKDNLLATHKNKIEETNTLLTNTKLELESVLIEKNSISFLGMKLSKIAYNLLLWSIIIILLFGLSFFIIKFFRSNILTKKAKNNSEEVEQEFEIYRKKTLEREQKLRRQLQDEINKQRNGS
jgi:hypothetical protein